MTCIIREAPLLIYQVELDQSPVPRPSRRCGIGEDQSCEVLRPFFAWLGGAREQIEAVAMDMNSAFDLEVKAQCPNAVVIYDWFHVVAKYGREVMDRVCADQASQVQDDQAARKVIKDSRWLLLRNADNLKPE